MFLGDNEICIHDLDNSTIFRRYTFKDGTVQCFQWLDSDFLGIATSDACYEWEFKISGSQFLLLSKGNHLIFLQKLQY